MANPAGELARYSAMAAEMLSGGIKRVVGCYTSSSRKEIIPHFEKADALLWYPSQSMRDLSSNNVVYTGAVATTSIYCHWSSICWTASARKTFCVSSELYLGVGEQPRSYASAINLSASGAPLSPNAISESAARVPARSLRRSSPRARRSSSTR